MTSCAPSPLPLGFADLAALLPDSLFAIGYASDQNFTGAPVPGYELPRAWLREEPANALVSAAASLRARGLRLIVYDAYRPLRATRHLATWAREHDPRLLSGFLSETSRHSKGLSVDLGLVSGDGVVLDMGGPWDSFDERATTANASGAALVRRMCLREALMAAGFDDYQREWWHFEWLGHERFDFCDVPYGVVP